MEFVNIILVYQQSGTGVYAGWDVVKRLVHYFGGGGVEYATGIGRGGLF